MLQLGLNVRWYHDTTYSIDFSYVAVTAGTDIREYSVPPSCRDQSASLIQELQYDYVTRDVFLMEAAATEQYLTVKIKVPTEEVTCLRRTSCAGMQIERWRQSPSNRCQAPQPPSLCATEKQISEHLHPTGANGRDRIDRERFARNVYRNKHFYDLRNLRLGYTVYVLNLQQSLKE